MKETRCMNHLFSISISINKQLIPCCFHFPSTFRAFPCDGVPFLKVFGSTFRTDDILYFLSITRSQNVNYLMTVLAEKALCITHHHHVTPLGIRIRGISTFFALVFLVVQRYSKFVKQQRI